MATTQDLSVQDPLGLKQFALTESAYDLINSLIGIYSRLIETESGTAKPAFDLIKVWHKRVLALTSIYYEDDWTDATFVQSLINKLSVEYKQATNLEAALSNSGDYDTHTNPRTLPTI